MVSQLGGSEQQIKAFLDKQESETAEIEADQRNNPNAKMVANLYAFDDWQSE